MVEKSQLLSFDKKRMNPNSVLSPGLRYSIICIDENCQAIFFINVGLELDKDMKKELHISLAKSWGCSQYNMNGIL